MFYPWIFTGRTGAEAPIFWQPDGKSQLKGKDGKDGGQEKGVTEDEMVGCHHRLNGHESEQNPGDGEGQGSLERCSPWGWEELDMTDWLKNNALEFFLNWRFWSKTSRTQVISTLLLMRPGQLVPLLYISVSHFYWHIIFVWLDSKWGLSSLTRDRTRTHCSVSTKS